MLVHSGARQEDSEGEQPGSRRRAHQRQGGGDRAAGGEGGHHHQRVDGILPVLREHAQHRPLRQRQVAGKCLN